ncbi:hypothetical protein D623_10007905 [Myotis brandtii]|uniref:Uncharacterized protein n=1 Tax=Myotis brandtii TaxID=109478 RepID=S7P8H5_MYOBR|nr:hypothetical protein D623_10007905 [Myotis brandtii]
MAVIRCPSPPRGSAGQARDGLSSLNPPTNPQRSLPASSPRQCREDPCSGRPPS